MTALDVIGVKKLASLKKYQENASRAWLSGLVCSVVAGVYTLWRLREKEKTVDRKEGEGVVEAKKIEKSAFPLSFSHLGKLGLFANISVSSRERSAARIQLFSDLCDLTVPLSSLGFVDLDDGLVGIAGTISSLIGVWSQWKKTA